jgi:hypothetical protein
VLRNDEPQKLGLLARLVVVSILALIVAGIVWHCVSIPIFLRIWHDVLARPDARMRFRFILQPLMAAIVAIRDGLNDARTGNEPYFWTMVGNPRERTRRLNEGLNATARIILTRARDGRDLPRHCAKAVLSGRGGHCGTAVCVCPLRDHARAGRAHRAPMERGNAASNLVRAPI